jgi:hypothetical protein
VRTWKCSQCGHTEEVTYDWLAEHGGPVCPNCDCDMTLQPKADTASEHLPFGGSHAPDCPYRVGGECLCWRSDPDQNPELAEEGFDDDETDDEDG